MLLKRIAETVSGATYRALVAERTARPLGLRRTFVAESVADLATLAPGTSCLLSRDGVPRDVRAHYHPGWVSHGVVASTAFHAVELGGASVCAMGAIEKGFSAEGMVFDVLDRLAAHG